MKVFYKKEPGHVFIILEKKDTLTNQFIAKVWGFYPVRPVSCILFKKTNSVLTDNSKREYNAAITKTLTKEEFNIVKLKAATTSVKSVIVFFIMYSVIKKHYKSFIKAL